MEPYDPDRHVHKQTTVFSVMCTDLTPMHLAQVSSYTSEEEAFLDLQLEYASPQPPLRNPPRDPSHSEGPPNGEASEPAGSEPEEASEAAAPPPYWARRASAAVRLLLRPSVQVNMLQT